MSNFADRILAQLDPGDLKRVWAELGSCTDEPFVRIEMMAKAYGFSVIPREAGFEYRFKQMKGKESPIVIRKADHILRPEIAFRQVVRAITGEFGWTIERIKKEWSK